MATTSDTSGLTGREAQERLGKFGFNELPSARPKSFWNIALDVMNEPMFLLLISCGALYIFIGDYREGIVLLSSITIIIFITFYQYQKTEKALEKLKSLSSPRALVIRDQVEIRISGREVVPDDVVLLHEGDRVPADGELIQVSNLLIDESILTGESASVDKFLDEQGQSEAKVYSGTLVLSGKGKFIVSQTGINTRLGKIGISLQTIGEADTRLKSEMKVLVRNFSLGGLIITLVVIASFYFTRGNFVQALLTGLSSAMAILPEEFPVVLTVFLALGAWTLSKKNVLTRKPSAIETLGSATVLCSDKTGTITQNKMEVAAVANDKTIFLKGQFQGNQNEIAPLLTSASFACSPDSMDPMEVAIQKSAVSFMAGKHNLELVKEYPFSRELMVMTRVFQDHQGQNVTAYCKGAPEHVFRLCRLHNSDSQHQLDQVSKLADKGLRVLAIASSALRYNTTLPSSQDLLDFNYLGLVGLADPIRPEVPQAVAECMAAGVRVVMITGDFSKTAVSIGRQIGLKEIEVMDGDDVNRLSDAELKTRVSRVNIFARVLPEHKLRIVNTLKDCGEIVAMTGDGVNDAPALKAADIGVAMGMKGTDVSREASALVLLDDNFASIVGAIRQGRKIFDNLQKAMAYILAIHIPIIGLTLLPAFIPSLPILLLPLHIVFMELIIDPVCSVAFESVGEEKGIMQRPPRSPNQKFFGWNRIMNSVFRGALLLIMVAGVYVLSIKEGHTEGEVRAIAFSALIIGNIFLIITSLSKTRFFWQIILERNMAAIILLNTALGVLFFILLVPALRSIFKFDFPGYFHFIPSISGAVLLLIILELGKFFGVKNLNQH